MYIYFQCLLELCQGQGGLLLIESEEFVTILSLLNLYCVDGVLYGPLHNETAVKNYEQAMSDVKAQGGTIVYGGKVRGMLDTITIQFMYVYYIHDVDLYLFFL